ncbi:hypothetical protein ABEG18_18730 [Alsobacter sp. KACC 23698]|uniref:Uncharacterized protein n=1 Tax=Alsobacter sp. KACC 23698 TaxID=3149229 RepID=A0AAU7JBJ0_9HYPH
MPRDVDLAWTLQFRFGGARRRRVLRTARDVVDLIAALTDAERRCLHWASTLGAISRAMGSGHAKAALIATEMVENALAVEGWLLAERAADEAPSLLHA